MKSRIKYDMTKVGIFLVFQQNSVILYDYASVNGHAKCNELINK